MSSLNKVMLIGRLGKDPEAQFGQSGNAFTRLAIATTENFKDKNGEWKDKTEWHNVVVFGKTAENCAKFLQKGSLVYVEGKIETTKTEKDDVVRYNTSVVAMNIRFLSEIKKEDKKEDDDLPWS